MLVEGGEGKGQARSLFRERRNIEGTGRGDNGSGLTKLMTGKSQSIYAPARGGRERGALFG